MERTEIRIAGTGGQGVILAGILLADAAVRDGKKVVQTQSYGPEARGGASRAEVIISDAEIYYPKVLQPDILLCLSQEACDRYGGQLRKGGLLILDSTYVQRAPLVRAVRVPITAIARKVTGRDVTANIVALGVLMELSRVVSREAMEAAIRNRVPPGTEEMNLRALEAGLQEGARVREALRL